MTFLVTVWEIPYLLGKIMLGHLTWFNLHRTAATKKELNVSEGPESPTHRRLHQSLNRKLRFNQRLFRNVKSIKNNV